MKNSKVTISIVLYKTNPSELAECAKSIIQSSYPVDVIVIDNSPEKINEELVIGFGFQYLHLPSNPGYGSGHNRALIQSIAKKTDYHLVLNADVQFPIDAIENIVKYMDKHQNVAHLMPKVLNSDGSLQRLCKLVPSPFDLLLRRFLPRSLTQKKREKFELWNSGYDKTMFVPYLSGCFMFLRVSALKSVGIFDERYFMYPEDIDLTRRLAIHYDTIFLPSVSVTHLHGAASYKSIRMLLIHSYNIIKYFNKWGWFYDKERQALNEKTISLINGANDGC
jgi:GT2 family glycosyltransferase